MPGESSSETENPYGRIEGREENTDVEEREKERERGSNLRMHVTEPVRATIPVQDGARLSWDP